MGADVMNIRFPCSFEQGEMIADFHLYGGGVVILDTERMRLVREVELKYPNKKIKSAQLDVETCEWLLELEIR
jgi:hypothetical protein